MIDFAVRLMTEGKRAMHAVSMMVMAVATEGRSSAGMTVVFIAVAGAVIYGFGYARAVMHRANRDYKTTKAAVPVLRKGFWAAWWSAVKVGFWVTLAFAVLIIVMVHRSGDDPAPASDTKPSPSHSNGWRR